MYAVIEEISRWAIPVILLVIPLAAMARGVGVFEAFVEGAEKGFSTAVKTIPYLVAMMVSISIFRASGAMDVLVAVISPALSLVGFPAELLPHALMRPLSGGAALGIASDIIATHGPDSYAGRLVSTMQGTSDTT
ncbi:MAG: spore maturation protein, partial [Peptococcaceae bacterium]|nr:spore maturation protein [Peptococcaceae bacterium]